MLIIGQKGFKIIPSCEICKSLMVPMDESLESWECIECFERNKEEKIYQRDLK